MDKKIVVISGVNLVDAGPLSVYLDFLNTLVQNGYSKKYRIIALVGKKELFIQFEPEIEFIEFRNSKKSWLNRLYLEFFYFNNFSQKMKVYIWISMHDITPNVKAEYRYVYCHNPSPFNEMGLKDAKYGIKYYLFSKFYKYLYKINIQKNDAVIVQQDWMRHEFIKMYNLKKVIVARPSLPKIDNFIDYSSGIKETVFICPSFPRYYKNFQVVCEAAKLLQREHICNFIVYITLTGNENKYAKFIKKVLSCGFDLRQFYIRSFKHF